MNVDQPLPQQFVIVDDHAMVLNSTVELVQKHYPGANIHTAPTAQQTMDLVAKHQPDAVIIDLSIPESDAADAAESAQVTTGIHLLSTLMEQFPSLHIVVQSAHVQTLIRLKPEIIAHGGGFTIVDKSLPTDDLPTKLDWSLRGLNYLPQEMRTGLEFKPEWLEVLLLAFQAGLQDKAIAERMNIAPRTVRHYWTKIQGALGVCPEEGKNIRIQTLIRAREEGLID
jgi:DNA-binding NarL/FixJ family response regulator